MAERDDTPCGWCDEGDDDRDGTDAGRADGEPGDERGDVRVAIAWADLTRADYETLWRQTEAFASVARELRAIIRGHYPDML